MTEKPRYKRSLKSLKLTRQFHYRYLGFWVLICLCMLAALNLILFLYIDEHWGSPFSFDTGFFEEYLILRHVILAAMWLEIALFTVAIVGLAKVTVHRIAGPLVRLRATFDAVAEGKLDQKLKFRDYDHLEEVEASFNRMMETLRARMRSGAEDR